MSEFQNFSERAKLKNVISRDNTLFCYSFENTEKQKE